MSDVSKLPVKKGLVAGADAGGTKVHILDTDNPNLKRFPAPKYPNLYELLDDYFEQLGARPERMAIAMAGPRSDETGDVYPTNVDWPPFLLAEATRRYPGTKIHTMHDLASVAAGITYLPGLNTVQLKSGKPVERGPKLAITISTGVGMCVAAWDIFSKRYFFFSGEAGHIGFQPYTEAEYRHLAHLFTKFDHPSVELAISGKHGIETWLEHSPELNDAPELTEALTFAMKNDQPTGAVLLEFAKHGEGKSKNAAAAILDNIGSLIGNVLADFALTYRSTGGIYLTGSVSMGLSEYWAEYTGFEKAFRRYGTADHANWKESMLGDMPIYLIADPNIGVEGAFELAKRDL